MDLYSRKIVGWSVSDRMTTGLVKSSLEQAIRARQPRSGLMFHSDQGVQYASNEIQSLLANNEIICSMSRKGECYDNAVIESFFDSLKSEWLYQHSLLTRTEAKQGLFNYIEIFYNRKRLIVHWGKIIQC